MDKHMRKPKTTLQHVYLGRGLSLLPKTVTVTCHTPQAPHSVQRSQKLLQLDSARTIKSASKAVIPGVASRVRLLSTSFSHFCVALENKEDYC